MEPAVLLVSTVAKQQWFWGSATVIIALLVLANVALFLVVYARRFARASARRPRPRRRRRRHGADRKRRRDRGRRDDEAESARSRRRGSHVAEYLRSFLASRMAWAGLNGLLIISGASGVFLEAAARLGDDPARRSPGSGAGERSAELAPAPLSR